MGYYHSFLLHCVSQDGSFFSFSAKENSSLFVDQCIPFLKHDLFGDSPARTSLRCQRFSSLHFFTTKGDVRPILRFPISVQIIGLIFDYVRELIILNTDFRGQLFCFIGQCFHRFISIGQHNSHSAVRTRSGFTEQPHICSRNGKHLVQT